MSNKLFFVSMATLFFIAGIVFGVGMCSEVEKNYIKRGFIPYVTQDKQLDWKESSLQTE
jgi:hypothetical protein